MLKLYHHDMSSCAQKVRFVLHEKQLGWESEELDLRRGDQFSKAFLKVYPKYLPLMDNAGAEAWPAVEKILARLGA